MLQRLLLFSDGRLRRQMNGCWLAFIKTLAYWSLAHISPASCYILWDHLIHWNERQKQQNLWKLNYLVSTEKAILREFVIQRKKRHKSTTVEPTVKIYCDGSIRFCL